METNKKPIMYVSVIRRFSSLERQTETFVICYRIVSVIRRFSSLESTALKGETIALAMFQSSEDSHHWKDHESYVSRRSNQDVSVIRRFSSLERRLGQEQVVLPLRFSHPKILIIGKKILLLLVTELNRFSHPKILIIGKNIFTLHMYLRI